MQTGMYNTSHMHPDEFCRQSLAHAMCVKSPGGATSLYGLTALLSKETTTSHRFSWSREVHNFPTYKLAAAAPNCKKGGQSSLHLENAGNLVPGVILENFATGEQVRVVNVMGNTAIVVRQTGIMSGSAMPVGTELQEMGTSYEQGANRPIPRTTHDTEQFFNYTQIQRHPWSITGTVQAECSEMQHPSVRNPKEAAWNHAIALERQLIWGQKGYSTQNGQPIYTSDGIISMIRQYAPQNVMMAPGVITQDMFNDMVDRVFDYNSVDNPNMTRVVFGGQVLKKVIDKLGRYSGVTNLTPGQTSFGMRFNEFKSSRGTLQIIEHPLFNTHPIFQRMALILDLSQLKPVFLGNRNSLHRQFNANLNQDTPSTDDNGIDARGGEFITEMGLKICMPESLGVIYGLCEAACQVCPLAPTTYKAHLEVPLKDCWEPCSVVTISVCGTKPNQVYKLSTPEGIKTLTADATGKAALEYQLPKFDLGEFKHQARNSMQMPVTFSLVYDASLSDVIVTGASVTVEICNPCDTSGPLEPDPDCNDVCLGDPPLPTPAPTPAPTCAPAVLNN